jgi:hypothetical protein
MDFLLFQYPDCTSATSGEMDAYKVRDLKTHGAASFYSIGDAYEAKEELIKKLHDLRQSIEVQKAGPQQEVFEI